MSKCLEKKCVETPECNDLWQGAHPALLNDVILGRVFHFLTDMMDMRRFRRVCSRWLFSSEALFRKRYRVSLCFPEISENSNGDYDNEYSQIKNLERNRKTFPWSLNEFFASSTRNVHINSLELGGIIPWTESELINFFDCEEGKRIVELSLDKILIKFESSPQQCVEIFDCVSVLGETVLRNLKKLTIDNEIDFTRMRMGQYNIPIQLLENIEFLQLKCCTIIVNNDERKISPKQLALDYCRFICKIDKEPKRITVNDFINFEKMKTLKLWHRTNSAADKQWVYLNMSSGSKISLESLHLRCIELEDFGNSNWMIEEFIFDSLNANGENLENLTGQNCGMQIKEAEIRGNLKIIKFLPRTIQRMCIKSAGRQAEEPPPIDLYTFLFPNLIYLKSSFSRLLLFSSNTSITDVEIEFSSWLPYGLTIVQTIPKNVERMKMVYPHSMVPLISHSDQGVHELRLLVLMCIGHTNHLAGILKTFPSEIVVLDIDKHERWVVDVVNCVNKERWSKKTLIGKFDWNNNDFQKFPFLVSLDRKANYYCFQNGKGKGLSESEFGEMLEF